MMEKLTGKAYAVAYKYVCARSRCCCCCCVDFVFYVDPISVKCKLCLSRSLHLARINNANPSTLIQTAIAAAAIFHCVLFRVFLFVVYWGLEC